MKQVEASCWVINLICREMDEPAARAIANWRYDGKYQMYTVKEEEIEATIQAYCQPKNHYFSVSTDSADMVLGYFCFGQEARVPGGDYQVNALDVGMGIHPNYLSRGLGKCVLRIALEYARCMFKPRRFRATVAAFNERALRLCLGAGFQKRSSFLDPGGQCTYTVLILDVENNMGACYLLP